MSAKKVLILIPTRFQSNRFPGKPLAMISGKSMIQRVYQSSILSDFPIEFDNFVITDDKKIQDHVKEFGGNVVLFDKDGIKNGTERVYQSYKELFSNKSYDLIINLQGDEPMLKAQDLYKLIDFHLSSDYDVATILSRVSGEKEFDSLESVKVIYTEKDKKGYGDCHYFSRSTIPYSRESIDKWFLHIGVYSFKLDALIAYGQGQQSYYEKLEGLEQLRLLDIGKKIGAIVMDRNIIGVNLQSDIKRVEKVISE